MKKCEQGHFYDDNYYLKCPFCGAGKGQYSEERELVTVAMPTNQVSVEEVAKLVSAGKLSNEEEPRTVGMFSGMKGNDFVTGWLVCIAGEEYGRDYRLHHGFNRIGRSAAMDVCIASDIQIMRDTHCQIVYEDKQNVFYLVSTKGSLVYLNEKAVYDSVSIRTGDKIQIGNTVLQFISFCEGDRRWKREQ